MLKALWMPVEMSWSTLDCGDYSSQSKTKTVLQGMKPACKKDQENFNQRQGGVYTVDLVSSVLIP